ncbi:MAG TPA: phosphoglucosamine mutase, partial [Coleofasciculaceae cyanobacterium]
MPFSPLFGTDGIRGKFGEVLTGSLAMQIGFWAGQAMQASALQPGSVIMGQDSRNSSDLLAAALLRGFTAAGVEVWDLGLCPTPAVAYLTSVFNTIGGVMISASHNPPEDNGIKFFDHDGSKLSQPIQEQIEIALRRAVEFAEISYTPRSRSYCRPELLENYFAALQMPFLREATDVLPLTGMHIVLDLAWGAAVNLAPRAFRSLGARVTCLHAEADGNR